MTTHRIRAYCRRCKHDQVFVRNELNNWLHLFLTIVTLGLWLVSWLAILIGHFFRPWRCKHCGWHKPEERQRKGIRLNPHHGDKSESEGEPHSGRPEEPPHETGEGLGEMARSGNAG